MKSTVGALVAVAVVILAFPIYGRRFQFEAKLWHWRHGYTIDVGSYVVPVPEGWLVQMVDPDGRDLFMLNTYLKQEPRVPRSADVVDVMFWPQPLNLNSWETMERQLLERDGLQVERLALSTADEKFICLGGNQIAKILHVQAATILSFHCQSGGPLSFMYQGNRSGIEDFKAIAAQVHKRN